MIKQVTYVYLRACFRPDVWSNKLHIGCDGEGRLIKILEHQQLWKQTTCICWNDNRIWQPELEKKLVAAAFGTCTLILHGTSVLHLNGESMQHGVLKWFCHHISSKLYKVQCLSLCNQSSVTFAYHELFLFSGILRFTNHFYLKQCKKNKKNLSSFYQSVRSITIGEMIEESKNHRPSLKSQLIYDKTIL